ncbi:MAG: hypothetical protein J2P28_23215 [Actinobacteria bacterium]|nr:hypothetical protein [Actinomycetota bacterium]
MPSNMVRPYSGLPLRRDNHHTSTPKAAKKTAAKIRADPVVIVTCYLPN